MTKVEQLEGRRLLSGAFSVVDGTLIIQGTSRADQITVSGLRIGPPGPVRMLVTLNGRSRAFDLTTIQHIRIEAGAGDDLVLLGIDPFDPAQRLTGSGELPATLLGGDGDDTLVGGQSADLLLGGNGRDALAGSLGNDTLDGGSGSDELRGQDGADLLLGGRGNDRFTLQGDDTVDGGLGNDLYAKVSPRGRAKVKNVEASLSGDVLPDAHFDGTTLVVTGTHLADVFGAYQYFLSPGPTITVNGDSTVNILGGGIDHIRLVGGAGDDSMLIGPEDDSYGMTPEISPVGYPLELVGGAGNDSLTGSIGPDTLLGDDGDDVLAGGPSNDDLAGGAGNDTLRGNGAGDVLAGGTGADSLDGGAGADYLSGGDGADTIFGGPDADLFQLGDDDAERKDRQSDEWLVQTPPNVPPPPFIGITPTPRQP